MTEDRDKTRVLSGDQETLKKDLEKAKESDPCFIVVRGPQQGAPRLFIRKAESVIGREPSCDIPLTDTSVSRKHAVVTKNENDVLITDSKSANGTMINGKKVAPGATQKLAKEDLIQLGNTILKFLPAGELEILAYGKLESDAYTDPLTKVYNRRYLLEAMEAEFKRAKALNSNFAVAVFDIDFFKKINDSKGHDAGDYVLKEFCALIKNKYTRTKDVFGRFGGEEFIMYFLNASSEEAEKLSNEVRTAIEMHPFIYNGARIPVTVSIGVAEITSTIENSQTLFKEADKALYKAKENGRNQVVVAS